MFTMTLTISVPMLAKYPVPLFQARSLWEVEATYFWSFWSLLRSNCSPVVHSPQRTSDFPIILWFIVDWFKFKQPQKDIDEITHIPSSQVDSSLPSFIYQKPIHWVTVIARAGRAAPAPSCRWAPRWWSGGAGVSSSSGTSSRPTRPTRCRAPRRRGARSGSEYRGWQGGRGAHGAREEPRACGVTWEKMGPVKQMELSLLRPKERLDLPS